MSLGKRSGGEGRRPPGLVTELRAEVYTWEHILFLLRTSALGAMTWKLLVPAPSRLFWLKLFLPVGV